METMQLSLSSLCHLCGESRDGTSLTHVHSEKGKVEKLEHLIDQYIIPILLLPKDDKLCICDTCKTRLQTWDAFIEACRRTQERLNTTSVKGQKNSSGNGKRGIDSSTASTNQGVSSHVEKRKKSSNYCIARWCNKGNYQGVSLFRLPRERDRALIWLSAAERADLKCMATLHSYYLCANHFTSNMFTNKACNQLIRGAVPTLFPSSPYANKTSVKKTAPLLVTPQLQGVKFKSILPKVSSSTNVPVIPPAKAQEIEEIRTGRIKPESKWSPIVMHVLPQVTRNQLSTVGGHNPNIVLEVISSNPISRLYSAKNASHDIVSDQSSIVTCSTTSQRIKDQGGTLPLLDSSKTQVLYEITSPKPSSSATTNQDSKQGKIDLEIREPCIPTEEVSSSALPPAGSSTHSSNLPQKLKEDDSSISVPSYIRAHSKTVDSEANEHNACDPYESIVGSQDVLLPHVSKSRISTTDSGEQTFMLMSTSSHGISTEGNSLLSNTNEVNAPNMGLFDLRADEMQGTGNATFSNMVNLDELMDLDHYFNR